MKRTYRSPLSLPTEVAFEQALLVTTARLLMEVDELENVNATSPRVTCISSSKEDQP